MFLVVTIDVTMNAVSEAVRPAVSYTMRPFQTADREQPNPRWEMGRHKQPEAEKEDGRGEVVTM